MEQFDITLESLPYFTQAYLLKGRCLLTTGKLDQAFALFNHIPYDENKFTVHWGAVGYVHSLQGNTEKVKRCLKKIQQQEKIGARTFLNWSYAIIYLALDQIDMMYHYLEKSLKEKCTALLFIKVDPIFDPFRQDERFINLLGKYFP